MGAVSGASKKVTKLEAKTAVSVLIPVFNEEADIEACIRSVQWAADIVVVDSGSLDGTCELAAKCGARVVQFHYVPGGPKKKNWALGNVDFKYEWILILDADERVTAPLAAEIHDAMLSKPDDVRGFYINRRFYFLNRWIRHAGYYPSWNLRLLRRGSGTYEQLPDLDSVAGDNEVHEHILLKGRAAFLSEPMDHFAFPSVYVFIEKHNRYSSWEAQVGRRYLEVPKNDGHMAGHLAWRRLLKRLGRSLPFPGVQRFAFHYFIKLGFLDGKEGYVFCRLLAEYEFLIWAKTIESRLMDGSCNTAR